MISSKKSSQLSELISRSRGMLEYAEAGQWEKVIVEEKQHSHLLKEFFSIPSNIEDSPEISVAIREIMSLNEQLQQFATCAREKVRGEADNISNGRRAVSAYAKNSR